jgi:hypothetical protein
MFLTAQGITLESNVLEQDNESAIKLETNGQKSAGKQSRHIDIRYFYVKDRIQSEGMVIHHCPTELMIADFFTKPLQGSLFSKFRDVILGHRHTASLSIDPPHETEERVENSGVQSTGLGPVESDTVEYGVVGSSDTEECTEGEWSTVTNKKKNNKKVPVTAITKKQKTKRQAHNFT